MGLLQAAYRTYENYTHFAGKIESEKEPLVPVSHIMQNAGIEIELTNKGVFLRARSVGKEDAKTIIPATIESANRVGDNTKAHPLCDQLRYLAPYGGDKFEAYVNQLSKWESSGFSHPKASAVLRYIKKGTIVSDLADAGVIQLGKDGNPADGRLLVRWRVHLAPEHAKTACFEDSTLFDSFAGFYSAQIESIKKDICLISGQQDAMCEMHPKGVVPFSFGAKLISSNDSSGYTYRGRFTRPDQAYSVGYHASQKAHNALRWVVVNHGVFIGGRAFLCWNTENKPLPSFSFLDWNEERLADFPSYKNQMLQSLGGYKDALKDTDQVIIAAMEAATTGRLSVTYYNELQAPDFLDRLAHWYTTCCWDSAYYGIQSPPLHHVIHCAFGTLRNGRLETDDRIMREYMQRLLHCIVDQRAVPQDVVKALVTKAGNLQVHSPGKGGTREMLLTTACAMIRKYKNDKYNKEEWAVSLNTQCNDRSYLFGRLLAVAEKVERSTYSREEGRETNAIRMQSVFAQRPLYTWRVIEEKLVPYFSRLPNGLRVYYKNMIGEIVDMLPDVDEPDLGKKLDDTYLMGYYHQRSVLNRGKNKNDMEESKDEFVEEQN